MNAVQPSKGYAEAWILQSRTDPTQSYIVSKRPDGTFACACPAWKFARAPKPDCKHINAVRGGWLPIAQVEELNELQQPRAARARVETVRADTSKDDWKYEVANDDTVLGFAEWQQHRNEANRPQPKVTQFGDFTIRRKFRL